MKWGAVFGISVITAFIVLFDWRGMKPNQKKEKAAYVGLTAMAWMLGVTLIFIPDLPGPSKLLDALFRPLGKLLEK